MENALSKYSIDEIKQIIEKNKNLQINTENIEKGFTGVCSLCGEEWDMSLHWKTVIGEVDNEEYLLIENTNFGIVHDVCNSFYDEGEFDDLVKALEGKVVKKPAKKKDSKEIKEVKETKEVKAKKTPSDALDSLPIHESLEIIKSQTFRKSDKYWTEIVATKSTIGKNAKTILAFYRWRKGSDGTWKRMKKWTINSAEDWATIKKLIDDEFSNICWK